ncbi:MAG: hypothetical protein AABZ45_08790 [Pseudomonadota bacterium]
MLSATLFLVAGHTMATPSTVITPAPAPPSSGRVQGPPDGMIPPPPADARPMPFPFPSQTAPAPTPAPTTIAPASPAPVTARPTLRPRPAPASQAPAPSPYITPSGLDTPVSSGEVLPPALPTPALPSDSPAAPTSTREASNTAFVWPEWVPLVAIGGIITALISLWLWLRRRRNRPLALPAPDTVEQSAAEPAPQPIATPKPDPVTPRPIIGKRADLSMTFEPLAAQSTLVNFRLRYAITLANEGAVDAANVTLRIGLFAGTQASENGIAQWLVLPDQGAHHAVDVIAAGGEQRFEGELAAPLDALGAMTVEGRTLAIALMAIDARYHHAPSEAPLDGQVARAFVVGREPPQLGPVLTRLIPFRLDQGPTSFAPLGTRDTGISRNE